MSVGFSMSVFIDNGEFLPLDGPPDGTDGAGQPGTPTGGGAQASAPGLPFAENGGVLASNYFLFIPVQDQRSKKCYIGIYDATSFNDLVDGSSYSYRAEDVVKNSVATVSRIWLTIRDLGVAKLTLSLSGTDDNQKVTTVKATKTIGSKAATQELFTYRVDLSISCFRPQLTLTRKAGGGPICITEVTLEGTIDDQG